MPLGRSIIRPRNLPHGAPRRAFSREITAWTMLPVMVGAVEGGVMGTIASRLYQGIVSEEWLDLAVAFMVGAKAFANLASIVWAAASSGRRKVRFIVTLMMATALCVLGVSFLPQTPMGLVGMAVLMTGASICWSGVVTLRTTVWAANYPRDVRATIAGRLAIVQALALACVGLLIGWAQDLNPDAFRWMYPIAVGVAMIGIATYAGLPLRGHRRLLRTERTTGRRGFWAVLRASAQPLARDRTFRLYMGCLFMLGFGNIMVSAPLVLALRTKFDTDYLVGIALVSSVPILIMPLAIPLWSRLLDRVHVIRFRAVHSWVFVTSNGLLAVAILTGTMWLLWIAAIVRGAAFGGGVLAWNLGHHDFAPIEGSGAYMGTHVTLTGIRGLLAPLVGVYGWHLIGGWIFTVPVVMAITGGLGFAALAARGPAKQH